RRGLFAAIPPTGNALGVILAAAVLTPFTLLPKDQFLAWGWRVPFLVSILILPVGLYIRMKVAETPAFAATTEHGRREAYPVVGLLRRAPRPLLPCFLVSAGPN